MARTLDELADALKAAGGKEYPHPFRENVLRAFYFKTINGPDCDCNDKVPNLGVIAWADTDHAGKTYPGSVEFEVCGERNGEWLKAHIYTVKRAEALVFLPPAARVLSAVWRAYCDAMGGA